MTYASTIDKEIANAERNAEKQHPHNDLNRLAWNVGALRGILRALAIEMDVILRPEIYSERVASGCTAEQAHELIDGIRAGLHTRYIDINPEGLQDADALLKQAYETVGQMWDAENNEQREAA